MVWSKLILIIYFFTFSLNALELSQEEKDYFNILDLDNDNFVSFDEITQSTNIIFQLIDLNKDYNEDEDGYYINAEEEYIEFYELIYEHWLNGTFSGESSIIHHLARNWLEENNW